MMPVSNRFPTVRLNWRRNAGFSFTRLPGIYIIHRCHVKSYQHRQENEFDEDASMTVIPDLSMTRLTFHLTAESEIRLPRFPGSVFRGGFGMALRRACCTMKREDCRGCMLVTTCVYARVFETTSHHAPDSPYQMADYPRPFVLEPPYPVEGPIAAGSSFRCHLVLLGHAVEQLPYFVYAFTSLGRSGLGRTRGKFRIEGVTGTLDSDEPVVFDGRTERFVGPPPTRTLASFFHDDPSQAAMTIVFETPTRIKDRNHFTKTLSFDLFMRSLLRRMSILAQLCTGHVWDLDYRHIIQQASEVRCSRSNLYWFDWGRRSGREKNRMRLGGFLGSMVFEGDLAPFLPFIRMGEYCHVGKASTFGLGKFHVALA